MPDLIRHPELHALIKGWIPGQARNDKLSTQGKTKNFDTATGAEIQ